MIDRATYEDPAVLSEGIRHVFVNGVAAVRDGTVTGWTFRRRPATVIINAGDPALPPGDAVILVNVEGGARVQADRPPRGRRLDSGAGWRSPTALTYVGYSVRMLSIRRTSRTVAWTGALLAGLALAASAAQQSFQERRAARSAEQNKAGLAEPFKGVTTGGSVVPGLFGIRSTGVSTAPVRDAAAAFLGALTEEQRKKTVYAVDDNEWRMWMNQHGYLRQGVSFEEMSEPQREAAFSLMRSALSAKGLKLSRDIMRLNHTLGELNNDNWEEYGEWLYHITVMGTPSQTEPWGWQLDGHHLIVNYFVLGDQVVMTPLFVGSEPVTADAGKYKGTTILQEEQAAGLAMLLALDETQRKQAVVETAKAGNNNLAEAWKDNAVIPYAGITASSLSAAQREQLAALIQLFVDNMKEGHAEVKMAEVRAHLADTRFAWVGGTEPDSVFYYRIQSPVILVEFDHQRPANLRHLAKAPQAPTRQHIHVVVRTPNGNDYGKDLLRQHLQTHPH